MTVAEQITAEEELSRELSHHAGEWVAVSGHKIVAHAATIEELLEQATEQPEVEVFQVSDDPGLACFY